MQSKMRELHRKMKWSSGNELERLKKIESELKSDIKKQMDNIKQEIEQNES